MRCYIDRSLPGRLVVGAMDGEMWTVPASPDGWRDRRPYKVGTRARRARLRETPAVAAMIRCLGIPHGRSERRTLPQIVGDAVRAARKARGRTQVDLARATGLTQPTISGIESGNHWPSPETLGRLAEALGCPEAELLG